MLVQARVQARVQANVLEAANRYKLSICTHNTKVTPSIGYKFCLLHLLVHVGAAMVVLLLQLDRWLLALRLPA